MCHDEHARPPHPPGASVAARGEDIVLTAADGNRFAAYAAHPIQPGSAQVALFGDAHGLTSFYKTLALRFAEVGIAAVAIDYYGRTAGFQAHDASFDFMPHLHQLKSRYLFADSQAALAYLRSGVGRKLTTFTLGFCMGGALSFLNGSTDASLAGAIGLYAYTGKIDDITSFLDYAEQIRCPVLGLFGEADQVIPVSDVHAFDEKLDQAKVEHEIILYPGAPHGFFEMQQAAYADVSANAWKHVLDFINTHSLPHREMKDTI